MFGLHWLIDHNVLAKDRLEEYYASYVASIFRTLRFGTGEAHGRAEMMEFNYLVENNALSLDLSQIGSGNRSASNSRERSLCSEPKDALDEAYVFLCQPTHLSLADHVHRLVALDRS